MVAKCAGCSAVPTERPTFRCDNSKWRPGGYTPKHYHPYEHEVYVIEGEGEAYEGDTPHPIRAGDVVLVKPDDLHQFKNTGDKALKFLCLIPNSADNRPGVQQPECSAVAAR
ncbi:MAG: cupin domain-containing protein [Pirellulaceae bacterium]